MTIPVTITPEYITQMAEFANVKITNLDAVRESLNEMYQDAFETWTIQALKQLAEQGEDCQPIEPCQAPE